MKSARNRTILIRADASAQIGTGHVMRCLALAQAWQVQGGTAHFVMADSLTSITHRLKLEDMGFTKLGEVPGCANDAANTVKLALASGAALTVLDGYHFSTDYQQAIKASGLKLLFVDDYGHVDHYYADIVLNQNIYADESLYRTRESYTVLLLGTRYTLIRREFWSWHQWQREIPRVALKILITLGGSDPQNVTSKVIQALAQLKNTNLEAVVVVGAGNRHLPTLKMEVASTPVIKIVKNSSNMSDLMAWADVALSASGSTCWELAYMGLPALLFVVADNQELIAKELDSLGVAIHLGSAEQCAVSEIAGRLDEICNRQSVRKEMSRRGKALVDRWGGKRVLDVVQARCWN